MEKFEDRERREAHDGTVYDDLNEWLENQLYDKRVFLRIVTYAIRVHGQDKSSCTVRSIVSPFSVRFVRVSRPKNAKNYGILGIKIEPSAFL